MKNMETTDLFRDPSESAGQQEPGKQEEAETIIKLGKINFVVTERFDANGKNIDEIMEALIVKKCGQTA